MLSETVRLSYAVLCLNLSGPSDMEIICKAQSRHKMCVSQTSASKLNKAMCHFPDVGTITNWINLSRNPTVSRLVGQKPGVLSISNDQDI